jgi:prepilin-type processing-associated H-X9-DG protein
VSPFRKEPMDFDKLDSESDYVFVRGVSVKEPHDTIIVYERIPHHGDKVGVAFADGHVQEITVEERDRLLEEQRRKRGE